MLKLDREDWMKSAACRGVAVEEGFDNFFPKDVEKTAAQKRSGHGPKPRMPKLGKEKYCAFCSVKEECLDYAIRNSITEGCWGGVYLKERKTIGRVQRETFEELVSEIEPSLVKVLEDLESQMQSL